MIDYVKYKLADLRLYLQKSGDYSEFVEKSDSKQKIQVLKKAAKAANLEQKIFANKLN